MSDFFFNIGRQLRKVLHFSHTNPPKPEPSKPRKATLAERNGDIITGHFNRITSDGTRYRVENAVRDCLGDIAKREGRTKLVPGYREWLSTWQARHDIPDDYLQLSKDLNESFQTRQKYLADKQNKAVKERLDSECQQIADRNKDLIAKFLDIAERKVSIIDDYGDENWAALPEEIEVCMKKIAEREGLLPLWEPWFKGKNKGRPRFLLRPSQYEWIHGRLEQMFRKFHELSASKIRHASVVQGLSGEEFETYIAKRLRSHGFDVLGTPRTGDQGADLIAMRNGKTIVIQAKRYQVPVGNGAIQEVIGAVKFYGAQEGWVVTNSTFTSSAKALAQKGNIKLLDGHTLDNFDEFLRSA